MVWWYCKVGVCLPHFLIFFPFLCLQSFPPVISSSYGKRKYDVYFWIENLNAYDVCCLFWRKKEKIKIFFIIFGESGLRVFSHINMLIYKDHSSESETNYAHISGLNPPFNHPLTHTAPLCVLLQVQEVVHSSLLSVWLGPQVHINALSIPNQDHLWELGLLFHHGLPTWSCFIRRSFSLKTSEAIFLGHWM